MALTVRQQIAYTDTIDLYRPVQNARGSKRVEGAVYELAGTGVKCHIERSREVLNTSSIGAAPHDNMLTTDILHIEAGQECGSRWFVQLKTSGHPEVNGWYAIQGDATFYNRRANAAEYMIVRSTDPRDSAAIDEGI